MRRGAYAHPCTCAPSPYWYAHAYDISRICVCLLYVYDTSHIWICPQEPCVRLCADMLYDRQFMCPNEKRLPELI